MTRRRAWSWQVCALLSTLAGGCDYIFRLDHITLDKDASSPTVDGRPVDGSRLIDARPIDAAPMPDASPLCTNPTLFDPFNSSGTPCATWGDPAYKDMGVTVTENGQLNITPSSSAGTVGGCLSNQTYLLGSGLAAVVTSVETNGGAYNVIELHFDPTTGYVIKESGGQLRFQNAQSTEYNAVNYQASSMKWWRLRTVQPDTLVAEYSADGVTYTMLGSRTVGTLPQTVQIELTVGTTASGGTGHGSFDLIEMCP